MSDAWAEEEVPFDIPSYVAGDLPSTPLVFELDTEEDFTGYTPSVALDSPGLTLFELGTATLTGNIVSAQWPDYAVGPAGVWTVIVTLTKGPRRRTLEGPQLVIEEVRDGWHTLSSARRDWTDAGQLSDVQLYTHLSAARRAIVAFGTPGELSARRQDALRMAQLLQARSTWNVSKSSTGSEVEGQFGTIYIRPLDSTVRALVRPKSGKPVIV
jgi:hypothetical protein